MKRCPNCTHENAQASMYCENCGTLLPTSAASPTPEQTYLSTPGTYTPPYTTPAGYSITTQEQSSYELVPPPPPPSAYISPALQAPGVTPGYGYGFAAPVMPERKPRSFGAGLLSSILYLLGVFCLAFGLSGLMLHNTSTTIIGIVFVVTSIIALIVLVLLLIFRKYLTLTWWVRILIVVGLGIVGTIVAFIIGAATAGGSNALYIGLGAVFALFGLLSAIAAFW